jgi:very-short-patch-repair endonuclease
VSDLEEILAFELRARNIPFEREVKLIPGRRYRFDFTFPDHKLAVEVDGGEYVQGRHQRPGGFRSDAEKVALASGLGWRVMRLTGSMVKDGTARILIEQALAWEAI